MTGTGAESRKLQLQPRSHPFLPGRGHLWLLAGLAAWTTVVLLVQWPAPITGGYGNRDSAAFALAGEVLRTGGAPYLDYWDHKPVLIHMINAAGMVLSGGRAWGVWVVSLAELLLALWLAFITLRRAWGDAGAAAGTTLFASALAGVLDRGNMVEQHALPLQCGLALTFVAWDSGGRRSSFLPGLVAGTLGTLGFFLRANLIGAPVAVALVASILLLGSRRYRAWLMLLLGGASGAALTSAVLLGYLAAEGALQAFWDQAFRYNFLYAQTSLVQRLAAAYVGLQSAAGFTLVLPMTGWIAAAALLRRRPEWLPLGSLLLVLIWLPVEIFLASASGRRYPHYFLAVVPALALATGLFAALVADWRSRAPSEAPTAAGRRLTLFLCAAIAVTAPVVLLVQVVDRGVVDERLQQVAETAQIVRTQTDPGQRILVWGAEPDVYLQSKRAGASRFTYAYPLLTPGYGDTELIERFLEDLKASRPALIVDASSRNPVVPSLYEWDPDWSAEGYRVAPELEGLYRLLRAEYVAAEVVGPQGWIIYRRRAPGKM